MKNILFVITRLGGGGAERIMCYIIQTLSNFPQFQITILLLKRDGNTYLSSLPKNVNIKYLDISGRIRYNVLKIFWSIIKLKPNVCFCGLDKLNFLLAPFLPILKLYNIKTIVRETNVLSCQYPKPNFAVKNIYRIFYNMYDRIIAQSDDMMEDLINNWGIKRKKIIKINNPVDIHKIDTLANQTPKFILDGRKKNFIMIGRLTHQKGYDILFNQLSKLDDNIPYHIYILGTGELENELKLMLRDQNLQNKITFCGYCENPYAEIKQSSGLILASRYEGFPNVLLEANAIGKPIFTNNCPGGINEIVIDGVNGFVCNFNNPNSFKEGFIKFNDYHFDESRIKRMTELRYDIAIIMPSYIKIFEDI